MKKSMVRWMLPLLIVCSCTKDDPQPVGPAETTKGIYVLSEGNFGSNNAKLAFRDSASGSVTGDYFLQQNPTDPGLGDVANDIVLYGGKIYIVMNVSGNIVVLNAATGTVISRVNMLSTNPTRLPRYAVPYRNKLYISASDGTVNVLDTASLSIIGNIIVGPNPEGMAIVGNRLYVANSGAYNSTPDSTVSVVDLSNDTELMKIVIGTKNPQRVQANSAGNLFVSGYGDFNSLPPVPASVSVINSATNSVAMELPAIQYSHCRVSGDIGYFYNNYSSGQTCMVYNTITNSVVRNEFVTDGTMVVTPYSVEVNGTNGDVYIMDAKDYVNPGEVTCFSAAGTKKFSFSVAPGVNPNAIAFAR